MAHLLRVAEVAAGSTEAVLHEWGVAEGAVFQAGDVLATLETDKAVVDIEAESDGVLVKRLVAVGAQAEVGAPIALLGAPDELVSDTDAALAALGVEMSTDAASPLEVAGTNGPASAGQHREHPAAPDPAGAAHPERAFASPLARRMAREAGISVQDLIGTGPGGRIVKRDVRRALADQDGPAHPESGDAARPAGRPADVEDTPTAYIDVPHSRIRRATAARLTESTRTTPHFYLKAGVRVDELLSIRARLASAGVKVSVNDLVVRAVALAHVRVPEMNVIWMPDAVRTFTTADVAVAVATDRGLLTPVLRGVETMSLPDLAAASNDLIVRARSGALRQCELEGGTITVTNLGMFGVEEFSAIINPPHAAILAVGAVRSEPVVDDGVLGVGSVMHVGLAVDHRPVDGTVAARWLQVVVQQLQEPLRVVV